MEYVVLGLLMLKSQTLYDINKSFEQGISLFYSASYGSLQTTIKNLLKKGFITFEEKIDNGRNKKFYMISDSGKEVFFEWMIADIPTNKLEVTALSKLFFLGLIDSKQQKKEIIEGIIEKIQIVEKELQNLNHEFAKLEAPDSYKGVFHYQLKTLDYGIQSYIFAKGWFEELLRTMD